MAKKASNLLDAEGGWLILGDPAGGGTDEHPGSVARVPPCYAVAALLDAGGPLGLD